MQDVISMAVVTLRFIFISEPDKPVVTVKVPDSMLFQEALVIAAKQQNKDPTILSATYPAGTPITGGTVGEVAEKNTVIHVIDPSVVG
jgi:hypothetical protein